MTVPASTRLNCGLIRSRAAETGLAGRTFTDLIGVHLDGLEDLDQRAVSLTLLTRLSRVLGLTLDQLVIVADEPATPPAAASPADANLLLALLLAYGGLDAGQLPSLLNWTHRRLTAAAAAAEAILAPTPLRLVITDQQITCVLRPGSLPADVQTRVEHSVRTSQPLQAHEISWALSLIPDEILAPFQDQPRPRPADILTDLAGRGLAATITPCPGDPEQATARPHPDLMFALRLTGTPDAGDPADRTYGNDRSRAPAGPPPSRRTEV